jgi:hypothetical protein
VINMVELTGWLIWIFIMLAHSLGFWKVCKWAARRNEMGPAVIGGTVAGLTGWFWICAAVAFWFRNEAGSSMIVLVWFYGLLIAPVLGTIFTAIFWLVFTTLKLRISLMGRIFLGAAIGVLCGYLWGTFLDIMHQNVAGRPIDIMIFLLTPIACAPR